MMNTNNTIPIPIEQYNEMVAAYAAAKSLERYVKIEKYDVSREKIAAILGFELKNEENADM